MALVGPTAIGKTGVAVDLCRRMGGEIVSVDSRQVFRHVPISTNVPSAAELAGVRCHMTEVFEPEVRVDAARFIGLARPALEDVEGRGRGVVLTAGTGMYLTALLGGLDLGGHPADPGLRAELELQAERDLPAVFHRLQEVDPVTAERTDPRNPVRVVRRLELALMRIDGAAPTLVPYLPLPAVRVGLDCDRAELHRRIASRIDRLIEIGIKDEVERLLDNHQPSSQLLGGIGVAEMVEHLRGGLSLDHARQRIAQRTRAYARRQLTWFRADPSIHWIDAGHKPASDIVDSVLEILNRS